MKRAWEIVRGHPLIVVVVLLFVAYQVFGDALPTIDLEQALADISEVLGKWTYAAVGVLAFLETGAFVGLVFPGETAVILAGAIAGNGTTSIVLTIAIVWFSAWAGDSASFYIGTRLGRDFILRHGPRVRITPERFEQVEDYFGRYGGRTILVGRFIGLVRALAPFIAGSSGMTYRSFVPYSVLGTGLWAATFSLLGFFLAENLDKAEDLASRGLFVFGAVVAVLVGGYFGIRYMRHTENRSKLARRLEEYRLGKPVVAFGRRIEPQARFFWQRLTPGELGLEFTTLAAVLAVALFVVIGYGIEVGQDPGPTPGDSTAFDISGELRAGFLDDVAEAVTRLGAPVVTLAVALLAAILLGMRRMWVELAVLVAALAIVHAGVPLLKELVDRPRPDAPAGSAEGFAWPSGHAAYGMIYAWLAAFLVVRGRTGALSGTAVIVIGLVISAAVALSRVYLRVHYLSDVNAGVALSVAAISFCGAVALIVVHFRDNGEEA
ncbi:MAG: bifunctional DedA family/phosphatase PAP2 family protein [Actinomycetota bacterium]|nr:bifunctional DedA family/phosphatase PAP2 family protein [Actinomycetota bacterium]